MRTFNSALLVASLSLLGGCASSSGPHFSNATNEKILQSSGNTQKLIEFYKQQLAKDEQQETRIKLVTCYEKVGDYSSAVFYLKPLLQGQEQAPFDIALLAGKAYLNKQDFALADKYLKQAHQQQPMEAKVMNLLGVSASYQGNLSEAQLWFSKARASMGDDRTVKNNLAIVALLQGDYLTARRLLESLAADGGKSSKKVTANLALVYAKQGDKAAFDGLTKHMPAEQRTTLYRQLAQLQLVNMQSLSMVTPAPSVGTP